MLSRWNGHVDHFLLVIDEQHHQVAFVQIGEFLLRELSDVEGFLQTAVRANGNFLMTAP